jgi:hypothetical protein
MTRFLKAAFGLIFHHFGWKLLSLAAAAAIWAMVASEPELSTFATTQVEYKNLPPDIEIASNPVTTVILELRGPSGELQGLGGEGVHPQIVLDLSSATLGLHTYAIGDRAVKLPRGVRLVSEIPSEIRFNFENVVKRTVPVHVRLVDEGGNGYIVASESVSPPTFDIAGAASHVADTKEVVTDPVDLAGAIGVKTFRVTAFVADPFVHITSVPEVSVTVTMKKQ